jgi:hypothetical protein
MAFSVAAASPTEIAGDGGKKVTLEGTFELGNPYTVYFGTSVNAPAAYSGVPGQKATVYPDAEGDLVLYSPPLAAGVHSMLVVNTDTSEEHVLPGAITVRAEQFFTEVFCYRKLMPSLYRTGPRAIDEVE